MLNLLFHLLNNIQQKDFLVVHSNDLTENKNKLQTKSEGNWHIN